MIGAVAGISADKTCNLGNTDLTWGVQDKGGTEVHRRGKKKVKPNSEI